MKLDVQISDQNHERDEYLLSPVKNEWDSFFLSGPRVSDDFYEDVQNSLNDSVSDWYKNPGNVS
ncbi:TPA: hypothetical protein ACQ301_001763 [Yersinia enterocolitica]